MLTPAPLNKEITMRTAWIGVRMSDEEARNLRTVAEGQDRSMSWVLRHALSEYLRQRGRTPARPKSRTNRQAHRPPAA